MAREVLENRVFGDFTITKYLGDKKYEAVCNVCGETKELYSGNIKKLIGVTCSIKKVNVDLTNQYIGEWYVQQYIGNKKYRCICSCGNIKDVLKVNLLNGSSKSCGHDRNTYGDLTGMTFGEWKVIEKTGYRWKCQCSCGKIGYISSTDLMQGKTKSCGHGYNQFTDITGRKFGYWTVLNYAGNQMYICECKCKTQKKIKKADLLKGATKSCGCAKAEQIKETLYNRYGEIGPNKVSNPRSQKQIEAISSKENLRNFIESMGYKPLPSQLAKELGIQLHRTLTIVHNYDLDSLVNISSKESFKEDELYKFISSIYTGVIERRNREIIAPQELDIYLPELKIAIEFNGVYWHSSLIKEAKYHQKKTLDCARKGIRLIHIFEHEWDNNRNNIKTFLMGVINDKEHILYARNTSVKKLIDKEDIEQAREFCNTWHIQGWTNASIIFGCYNNNELVSIMSFSKPRFDNICEYEIIRYCVKGNVTVVGGAQKLFKAFTEEYKPNSVVTYSDISKFTGNIYLKLGFVVDKITEPNYVWVSSDISNVLSRYQTQKQKLLDMGLGSVEETEDEIMYNTGYFKVYDSGNIKLLYRKDNIIHGY